MDYSSTMSPGNRFVSKHRKGWN